MTWPLISSISTLLSLPYNLIEKLPLFGFGKINDCVSNSFGESLIFVIIPSLSVLISRISLGEGGNLYMAIPVMIK
jgi:hypothetical protein